MSVFFRRSRKPSENEETLCVHALDRAGCRAKNAIEQAGCGERSARLSPQDAAAGDGSGYVEYDVLLWRGQPGHLWLPAGNPARVLLAPLLREGSFRSALPRALSCSLRPWKDRRLCQAIFLIYLNAQQKRKRKELM